MLQMLNSNEDSIDLNRLQITYGLRFIVFFQKRKSDAFTSLLVGMTGFEPATLRPPDVYATGLRHIPKFGIAN